MISYRSSTGWVDNRRVHFTLLFQTFVVWGRTSACKGAPGSRYQSILTSPTPPTHSQTAATTPGTLCPTVVRGILKDSPDFFTQHIAFYLDGISFLHKYNPINKAERPKARIWRKKGQGLNVTAKRHQGVGWWEKTSPFGTSRLW